MAFHDEGTLKGKKTYVTKGYVYLVWPTHPNANRQGRVREHIAVAADALGRPLPPLAVVHHVNDDTADNRSCNLVICESDAYHKLLHVRRRVFRAGGNPDTDRICSSCKTVKPIADFSPTFSRGKRGLSRECKPCLCHRVVAHKKRRRLQRLEIHDAV